MMPRRERARLLLRALAKFVAVVVVAGGVGMALGIAISELTGEDDPRATISPDATTTRQATTSAGSDRPTTSTPATSQDPFAQVNVTVRLAVLHPAATAAGTSRQRARLGVRVKLENPSTQRVVLPRPSLLAARQRTPMNALDDGARTQLEPLDAGETVDVTMQFETAGAVTRELTTQKRARLLVGGRSSPVTVTVGTPVTRGSTQSGDTAP